VESSDLRETPLIEEHRKLGARLVPFAGWTMPVQYEGVVKEHHAVREAAGIFDVSHMGELELTGGHALAVVDYLVTNDVKKLVDGQAMYTVCCNEQGTILDDLIVYRKDAERFMIVCNASNRDKISAHFGKAAENHCGFHDLSDQTALIALQGPKAFEILKEAGLRQGALTIEPFHLTTADVQEVPVTLARTGYTGEDGVEIFCENDSAPEVWRILMERGEAFGLKPAGLGARDTLRLEAKLCLYGNDIDETTNPYEAALGWVVKLDKGDFVGRSALVKLKEEGISRKLVGLEMTGRGIARHGYPIVDADGNRIGEVTSGSPAPTLGKNIGLGYVPKAQSKIGTKLGVEIRGKVIDAVVVKTPFYRRNE